MKRALYGLTVLLAGASTLAAATINVPDDYTTLQAAVAAASPGDTIAVEDGVYTLTGTLYVTKTLTITGQSEAGVIIDASANGAGYGIYVEADNVVLQNFTVLPPLVPGFVGQSSGGGFAIHAQFTASPKTPRSNLTLQNITIQNGNRTPFDIHGYDGVTLTGLTAQGSAYGNGIQLTGCTAATVTGCTTSGNAWGGIAFYASQSAYLNRPCSGITFDIAANSLGETVPVYVEDQFGLVNSVVIQNATYRVDNAYIPGTAAMHAYTTGDLATAQAIAQGLNTKYSNTKSVMWDTGVNDPVVAPGLSLQAAIDAASPGDTIAIEAGTYTENITVNKQLRLVGAGSEVDGTIIAAASGDYKIGVVNLAASGTSTDPIELQDLRISAVGRSGISVGRFTEATGTSVDYVSLLRVKVIGSNTSPCSEQERGLYVDNTSTLTHLTVALCSFDNLHYGWYLQKQVSADTSTVQYVDVSDTTFNHNNSKGIYAEKLEDATFLRCTVSENGYDAGLLPACSFAPWMCGFDINLKAGVYQNLAFYNCTIVNNALGGAKEGCGLAVKARDDATSYNSFPAFLTGVTVRQCTVVGNERGIRIGEPGKNNAGPTGVVIAYNRLYSNVQQYSGTDGSAYGDLVNQAVAGVNAENNWWGQVDLAGSLNKVSGTVDIDPILPTSQVEQVLVGARLVALQNNDGGWDWPLNDGNPANASPLNTIGPIGAGLAKAYRATQDPAMLAALQNVSALLLTKVNNFSPSDGYLAAELDAALGVSTHVAHLKANFYGPLATSTYNRNGAGTLYSTASYVQLIRNNRAGAQANLAAWDVGMGLAGAVACGVSGVELATWVSGVEGEVNELDGDNYYDVIGLAGAVYGLKLAADDTFNPSAGEHAAAESLGDLADILADYQLASGGWTWNSDYLVEADYNETLQETAYAVLALNEMGGYAAEVAAGNAYLVRAQLTTGGWENYVGSGENNEVSAEGGWGSSMGNRLSLEPSPASLYLQPGESCVVDLNIANLTQPIAGLHAKLNFSSTFFKAGAGEVGVVEGGGVWNDLLYSVWNTGGDLDVSVGVEFDLPSMGTQADATTTIFTLTSTGTEGVTRFAFRPNGTTDTEVTMLSDAAGSAILPFTADAVITVDGTDPSVSFTALQSGSNVKTGSDSATTPVTIQGTVAFKVLASDALAGLESVTLSVAGVTTTTLTEGPAGEFTCTGTITPTTANGWHEITVTVTDKADNVTTLTDWLYVNRNQVTGSVELEGFVGASRVVTFVATGGASTKTWTQTLTGWASSKASYTLTDVPAGTTGISAKTAWTLREKLAVTPDSGTAVADFVADGTPGWSDATDHYLRGGDLNGSNSINIQDYAILKANWFTTNPVSDIDGNGTSALSDYSLMKANWFKVGDVQ